MNEYLGGYMQKFLLGSIVVTFLCGVFMVFTTRCGTHKSSNSEPNDTGEINSIFNPPNARPNDSRGVYIAFSVLYFLGLVGFLLTLKTPTNPETMYLWLKNISFLILVLGPPLFYPVAYYVIFRIPDDREYIKRLGEMWTPFWVAVAGLCSAFYFELCKK
jgi:hypothetical protein